MKTLSQSRRSMSSVLPKKSIWIKDAAEKFDADANEVITKQGHTISYDILIIAVGLQLCYEKVNIVRIFVYQLDQINLCLLFRFQD